LELLDDRELLKINPQDADQMDIADGEVVKIASRRGETQVEVQVTDICPPGVVSMTFHFWEVPTNVLTNPALDPVAKIPETKVSAVRVEKVSS
jgi:anaerobic selenocysteine-containing dehydrogenase